MPAPTPGSPRSIRIKVGTETPRRLAQTRCDSRRLTLAIARFSPSVRNARAAAGGRVRRAGGLFGITKSLSIQHVWSSLYNLRCCEPKPPPDGSSAGGLFRRFSGNVRRQPRRPRNHGPAGADQTFESGNAPLRLAI